MAHQSSGGGARTAPPALVRVLEWPVRLAGAVSTLLILATFVLVIYAVFQRYLLEEPLKWGDEMLGYILVGLVMSGAAEALRRGDHIAIDLVPERFTGYTRDVIDAFSSLAVLLFAIILGISSYESVRFSYDFGSYSPGYLEAPMWIPQFPLIVGAFLMGLSATARLIRIFTGVSRS